LIRKSLFASTIITVGLIIFLTGSGYTQAQKDQFVIYTGAGFNQATVTKTQTGFVGLDIQGYKMLTPNLAVGFFAGYDVVSYKKIGSYHERLTVMPILLKARYTFTLGSRFQLHTSLAGGVYTVSPHISEYPIGDISYSTHKPGGSFAVGFDFWYLLIQGIGGEFEYHFFPTDEGTIFSYFSLRFNYSLLKF